MKPAEQLPLTLPHRPQMTRADFLVGEANFAALALIDSWPAWRTSTVVLTGPGGTGKSHLVEIWRARGDAAVIGAAELRDELVDRLVARGMVAVEDLHYGSLEESALFHLLNLAGERGASVLLTSRVPVQALPIRIPDLASRLRAAQPLELGAPDDALLQAVLVKLFADRQIAVDVALLDYILRRMERSLEAANRLVDDLDRAALAEGVPVSRRLVSRSLTRLFDSAADEGKH